MNRNRQETSSIVRQVVDRIVVRDAYPDDALALQRLAAMDDRPALRGHVLVAEQDGDLVAATSVSSGRTIADPWRHTADLVTLLELRAVQVRREAAGSDVKHTRAASPSLRPVPAQL
jgi:hypothetical protein